MNPFERKDDNQVFYNINFSLPIKELEHSNLESKQAVLKSLMNFTKQQCSISFQLNKKKYFQQVNLVAKNCLKSNDGYTQLVDLLKSASKMIQCNNHSEIRRSVDNGYTTREYTSQNMPTNISSNRVHTDHLRSRILKKQSLRLDYIEVFQFEYPPEIRFRK